MDIFLFDWLTTEGKEVIFYFSPKYIFFDWLHKNKNMVTIIEKAVMA